MKQTDPQADEAFREKCRPRADSPQAERNRYGFYCTHRPGLDEVPWRTFNSMTEYRAWCEASLPEYLGCGRATPRPESASAE